jgi:hypothetical protein
LKIALFAGGYQQLVVSVGDQSCVEPVKAAFLRAIISSWCWCNMLDNKTVIEVFTDFV